MATFNKLCPPIETINQNNNYNNSTINNYNNNYNNSTTNNYNNNDYNEITTIANANENRKPLRSRYKAPL